jgi:hypothetical protein
VYPLSLPHARGCDTNRGSKMEPRFYYSSTLRARPWNRVKRRAGSVGDLAARVKVGTVQRPLTASSRCHKPGGYARADMPAANG